MQDDLKPVAGGPMPLFRKLKIASFDGQRIFPRVEKARTLGNLFDFAQSVYVTCDCDRRIVEVGPERFLTMRPAPSEDTPVRDLARYLKCRKCGGKGLCTVTPTGRWRPGMVPRVRALDVATVRQAPTAFPWGPPPPLPGVPCDDSPKGPKGRKRSFKSR